MKKFLIFLTLFIFSGVGGNAMAYPKGIWAFYGPQPTLSPVLSNNLGVVGVGISEDWSVIEPNPPVAGVHTYVWNTVDAKVTQAVAAGFKVNLVISNSSEHTPSWLTDGSQSPAPVVINLLDPSDQHSAFCRFVPTCLYWDPVFHDARKRLAIAAGAHFTNNMNIAGITIGFANQHSNDFNIQDNVFPPGDELQCPDCSGTIWASNGSTADVQSKISSAANGDTVTLPAGSFTWTAGVTIPKGITIKGAGAISSTDGGVSTTGSDITTILDHHPTNEHSLFAFTVPTGKFARFTGIKILQDGGSVTTQSGVIQIFGGSNCIRIDHNHFVINADSSFAIAVNSGVTGVIDHNYFDSAVGDGPFAVYLQNGVGDAAYAAADDFGTEKFIFMEDNRWRNGQLGDANTGGQRFVYRYNTGVMEFDDTGTGGYVANHGITSGRGRSTRAFEFYHNTMSALAPGLNKSPMPINGGTGLVWGNTVSQYRYITDIAYTRKDNATYNYGSPPTGWGNCDGSSGTVWDHATGYPALDQPGRGMGDLLSGEFPNIINTRTGNAAEVIQTKSPIYVWNNTLTPGGYSPTPIVNVGAAEAVDLVHANREFYQQFGTNGESGTFDGTKGVGQGLLSARPATCTTGVGYWATDTNTLYVATATNVWSVYYTPYVYPHPLTAGSGPGGQLCGPQVLDQPQQWLDAGWTEAKMVTVGHELMDTYATAFPNQFLKLPIGGLKDSLIADYSSLARHIEDYVYGYNGFTARPYHARVYMQRNTLNASWNPGTTYDDFTPGTGGDTYIRYMIRTHAREDGATPGQAGIQMVEQATGGANNCRLGGGQSGPCGAGCPEICVMQTALDVARTFGTDFIEIFAADGKNSKFYSMINAATIEMGGTPRTAGGPTPPPTPSPPPTPIPPIDPIIIAAGIVSVRRLGTTHCRTIFLTPPGPIGNPAVLPPQLPPSVPLAFIVTVPPGTGQSAVATWTTPERFT